MENITKIKTIETFNEFKLKEKGSVFLGQVFHIESETDAVEVLNTIKKKYYDATHHCYAYKLKDNTIKYSDDSEPTGTAGVRILNAIEHFDLISILVVVIRYFGGTKLGIGPLGKAYYNAANGTLENANIVIKAPYFTLTIITNFSYISHVHRILSSYDSKILDTVYKNDVTFICLVSPSDAERIKFQMKEVSKGNISTRIDKLVIYS